MVAGMGLLRLGLSELLIILSMNGLIGLPLGMPPQPEDPFLAQVAPRECVFYSSWSGMAEADPDSDNATERLLAEQELQQAINAIHRAIHQSLRRATENDGDQAAIAELGLMIGESILTRPAALFMNHIAVVEGAGQFAGGGVFRLDEQILPVRDALTKLQEMTIGENVKSVQIDDETWFQIRNSESAPIITWGTRGNYLIVGIGENAVQNILEDSKTNPPRWLSQLKQRLHVPRVSSVSYIDVDQALDLIVPLSGLDAGRILTTLGLDRISTYQSVTGLDEQGVVSRQLLSIEGPPTGLFQFANAAGLSAGDLQSIPMEAPFAATFRLDAGDVFDTFSEIVQTISPATGDQVNEMIGMADQVAGFSIRDDFLGSLGDVWSVYVSPTEGGFLTGWIATVNVRDRMTLQPVHQAMVRLARTAFDGDAENSSTLRQTRFGEHDIFYLSPDEDFPISPSWCLTQRELIVSLYPQSIRAHLRGISDTESMADRTELVRELAGDHQTLAIRLLDVREVVDLVYPLVQMVAQMGLREARENDIDVDISILPSASSITRHLRPSISAVRSVDEGLEMFNRQTIPGGNLGATAPVLAAGLLPAVAAGRSAARRAQSANNLRQIAIAMHNYHDVYGAFPPAYSTDANGNPLLSWRVHILPFLEQQALYERFHLDEPFNSPHNLELIPLMPETFRSPLSEAQPGHTNYLAVGASSGVIRPPNADERGPQQPTGASMRDVRDGTSSTVLAVEASDERAVAWTSPRDLDFNPMRPKAGVFGLHPNGTNAVMTDGSIRFLGQQIDSELLRRLFQCNDGKMVQLP